MSEETQDKTPEEIRRDIEQTREDLGDTVEALSAKTDVKTQTRAKVTDIKTGARERADQLRDKASDLTPDDAQQLGATVVAKLRSNPLSVGIVGALAVGYLLGRWSAR